MGKQLNSVLVIVAGIVIGNLVLKLIERKKVL